MAASPASAGRAESSWKLVGKAARAKDTPDKLSYAGTTYGVVDGLDDHIWWNYDDGDYRQHPVPNTTYVAPVIVSIRGRITIFHTGTDGQIYYSVLENLANNAWTAWNRVPGDAYTRNSPTVIPNGNHVYIGVQRIDGRMAWQDMDVTNGTPQFRGNFVTPASATGTLLRGGDRWGDAKISGIVIPDTSTENPQDGQIVAVGVGRLDDPLFTALDVSLPSTVTWSKFPGDALCESSVEIARGGSVTITEQPGDPEYAQQAHEAVACLGTDGYAWISQSSDFGRTWEGWHRPTDGVGASGSAPSLNSSGSTIDLRLRWNYYGDSRFPDNAIVEKSLY
ncbi:hypothetical protein [Streptomyces sp. NPDC088246]|uniref:hypothetical protein n=1 Tax=Streptomyces sp. NPDC088246 TaxID=3365842 RepID=UPI00380262D8